MSEKEGMSLSFQSKLQESYPSHFTSTGIENLQETYNTVLSKLTIRGNDTAGDSSVLSNNVSGVEISYNLKRSVLFPSNERNSLTNSEGHSERTHMRSKRSNGDAKNMTSSIHPTKEDLETEELLAVACHKLSIIIVCTLLSEVRLE